MFSISFSMFASIFYEFYNKIFSNDKGLDQMTYKVPANSDISDMDD